MPKASWMQNSFNAGEWSPKLRGRADLEKYGNACEILENFIPQIYGPATKRPGTRFVREVKDSSKRVRLIPFEYNTEQAYILEFGDQYIRFYANGGVILDNGNPYEITSPYLEDDVQRIHYTQTADVMYLTHPKYPPHKLSRFDIDNWVLSEVEFNPPPFGDENVSELEIKASAVTGNITLTASDDLFVPENVGTYFKFSEVVASKYDRWETAKNVGTGVYRYYDDNLYLFSTGVEYLEWAANQNVQVGDYRFYSTRLYRAASTGLTGQGESAAAPTHISGIVSDGSVNWEYISRYATTTGTTGTRPPIHLKGVESDGGVNWQYVHSGFGYVLITGYTNARTVSATVVSRLPVSATVGTDRWSESAWSDRLGYPKAVAFYEDRLWFAGSPSRPQTLWASVSGDYENHTSGTRDDDALNYTINSQEVNIIEWLSPGKILAIGTSGGEFAASASALNEAITPTNVKITPQTTYGSAPVQPFKIGGSVLFVQRASRKIRELTYSFENDSYVAPNMSTLAEHLGRLGFVDMTYQQEPDQIVWIPDSSGKIMGMTYERTEDVVGWHRHDVGGIVESMATIPHWDGDQDSTWMVVRRTINGQNVRYIEYFEKHLSGNHAFYMDCGLTYDGSPATIISGLNHLEGEEVTVITDGAVHRNLVVTGGQIELDNPASIVNVGLGYVATLKTMPIEAGAADGVAQGKTIRLNNIVIRLYETGPGLWYGPTLDKMDEYHPRKPLMLMDSPVPLFTGETNLLPWPSGYEVSPQVVIQHRLALPCTIVAVMPQLHTYDR